MGQHPITLDEILIHAERLSNNELEKLADRISILKSKRHTDFSTISEAEILYNINNTVLKEKAELRFQELVEIKASDMLNSEELEELDVIYSKKEKLNIDRLKLLSVLAKKRNQSLRQTMNDLGLLNQYE